MNRKNSYRTLVAAAVTGLLAGSASRTFASTSYIQSAPTGTSITKADKSLAVGALVGVKALAEDDHKDKHDCKGKNDCKGKGGCKTGDNECKGKNACKGKGGCKTSSI